MSTARGSFDLPLAPPRPGAHGLGLPPLLPPPPVPARGPSGTTNPTLISGRFVKRRVAPIKRYGAYRGEGSLRLDERGILVGGQRVRPSGTRWAIGAGIFLGVLLISWGRLFVGFIPIYFLLEYVFLENGAAAIGWDQVARFAVSADKQVVSIELRTSTTNTSPLVMRSDQWRALYDTLRAYLPAAAA